MVGMKDEIDLSALVLSFILHLLILPLGLAVAFLTTGPHNLRILTRKTRSTPKN